MKTILFYAPKGGVGSTTLAAHFAWHAARNGVPTVAVSLDPTGHLAHLLAGADLYLERDARWSVEPQLSVTFSPEELPQIEIWEPVPQLVVIDLKYSGRGTVSRPVDLWVVPVGNEQTLRNLLGGRFPTFEAERHQLLLNQVAPANDPRLRAREVAEAAEFELYPDGIPAAASIRQAVEDSRCVWDGPFKDSYSNRTLRTWARTTLQSVMQGTG